MLFNSEIFSYVFLPLSLLLTYLAGRWDQRAAKWVLLFLSLGFYAWWRPSQLPLLLLSIAFNYGVGELMLRANERGQTARMQVLLTVGVLADVAFLGWFKYANFFVDNINLAAGTHIRLAHIALPLAISFFTFQKIAYLIDTARGETRRVSPLDFSVFAAFYPQLIAGPIVHFQEVMPQLQRQLFGRFNGRNLTIGLVMFAIGMFKKTVIADTLSAFVNPMYAAAAHGQQLSIGAAWVAAIGFTLQLYFDFSGYSDMAIGLGRMLGVKLPLNFHSPLRAANITDYWRRWHMTLQRFVLAYIFQPLSLPLNRLAIRWGLQGWGAFLVSTAVPGFVTFVALGFWHGAAWTFLIFGVMHGVYVSINEAWRTFQSRRRRRLRRAGRTLGDPKRWQVLLAHIVTLLAVIYANVMFRAPSIGDAWRVWGSMSGLGGTVPPPAGWGFAATAAFAAALVFLAPNTQQIMGRFDPALNWREWRHVGLAPLRWTWKPDAAGLVFAGVVLLFGLAFIERGNAVFVYFNF
jgi:D-alanyl-lipoteichoic acid acyltransferase DltB (MBOAT superfamily)